MLSRELQANRIRQVVAMLGIQTDRRREEGCGMGELINGRTPEQIRFNVMECAHGHCLSECPYDSSDECTKDLLDDALTLIEHLEAKETTLNTLRDAIYEDAVAHGLWEDEDGIDWYQESHSMIECEVDELYDAIEDRVNGHGDEHFTEELADVIIMSMSVAGKLGIDIDAAIRRKMEINKGRPWKHGKETECNT